jgi:hypothetical protein
LLHVVHFCWQERVSASRSEGARKLS